MPAGSEAAIAVAEPSEALFAKLRPGPPGPKRSHEEVVENQRGRAKGALIGLVAERGYKAVTVRELAKRAGVSTRTLYEIYPTRSSKEACFLACQREVLQGLLHHAPVDSSDWQAQLRHIFEALVLGLGRDPDAARLALVESYAVGPPALDQSRQAVHLLAMRIGETLDRAPDSPGLPRPILEGIVGGAIGMARSRLLSGREDELLSPDLGDQMAEWALSYRSVAAARLNDFSLSAPSSGAESAEEGVRSSSGDLALLLSAATKIVTEGDEGLTVRGVLAAAGVPRRVFSEHFSEVDDCCVAAAALQADTALAEARQNAAAGIAPPGRAYRAVAGLCARAAHDSAFAKLCFGEEWVSDPRAIGGRERFIADVGRLVAGEAPPTSRSGELALEMSMGALWSLLEAEVTAGRAPQIPAMAGTLAYLALVPLFDPVEVVGAMRRGHGSVTREQPPS